MPHAILLFGFHDRTSPRLLTVRSFYEGKGKTVVECHTSAKGGMRKCMDLVRQYRKLGKECDTVVVTFPGHHLVWLAWILTRFPRKALVFDAFVSAYDTLVSDRRKIHPRNPAAWGVWLLDFVDCHLVDEILIDTEAHKEFFSRTFRLHPADITVLYLQAPETFRPDPHHKHVQRHTCEVLFYGSYIPLQGIDVILKAAAALERQQAAVHFTLVGGGQTYAQMRMLATEWKLQNVTFKPFVPLDQIPPLIHDANICLGIFGTSEKAQRVIPHKVVECMACGSTVITADSPAIREKYRDGEGIHLVPAGDAHALAGKIVELIKQTPNPSSLPAGSLGG
ncbi:glycosyltransferase family 4 protein [Candidatus Peribacteria bacterium]|nr:glycosyltransferase family 4 protein [Candidatus Peribacteria bacterium]